MKCKYCGTKLKVVKTEEWGEGVIRIRVCPKCGSIFRTGEKTISDIKCYNEEKIINETKNAKN